MKARKNRNRGCGLFFPYINHHQSIGIRFSHNTRQSTIVLLDLTMASSRRSSSSSNHKHRSSQRHYVVHNYHDHAHTTEAEAAAVHKKSRRGGVAVHFPVRLHEALSANEADGYAHIIGWQPHGRCFVIHKPREFEQTIMTK